MSDRDYYTDFSPKCMSFGGAFKSLADSITGYILLPLAAISLLGGIGPALTAVIPAGSLDFGMLLDGFTVYLRNLMIYSIPLIFLSVFIGLYEPGSYARIPFKFISSIYLAMVLLMFTKGGCMDVSIDGSGMGVGMGMITMSLEIQAVIYILAVISVIKGFLAFAEFSDNRKKYLKDMAKKFNKKEKKEAEWEYDDEGDIPQSKKKKKDEDDDEEDAPQPKKKKKDEDDEDDEDSSRKKKKKKRPVEEDEEYEEY